MLRTFVRYRLVRAFSRDVVRGHPTHPHGACEDDLWMTRCADAELVHDLPDMLRQ